MNALSKLISSLGTVRLFAMGAVTAGLIGFFLFITMRLTEPEFTLLYSDLDMTESSEIVQELEASGVPYQLAEGGRAILVPREQVNNLRVRFASEGIGGSIVGWEIFDDSETLGTTSFVQNINRLRAIEGELSRTIREIDAVDAARVHIVMPERQLFSNSEREPSASIVVRVGRAGLTAKQVSAIQYLVATAVPRLNPSQVSIIDQTGALLARGGEESGPAAMASNAEERRRTFEGRLRRQIESLLERTVGVGRVRAEVSVDMDMSRVTTNAEIYDPDSQVVRSTSTIEETGRDQEGGSDPDTVTAANNLPAAGQGAPAAPGDLSLSTNERTEEVINYEISRTVRTEVKEIGDIERISVAVLVDGTYQEAEDGTRTYQPRPQPELDQLAALVRSSIGYDAERGDAVEVVNLQFDQPDDIEESFQDTRVLGFRYDELSALIELTMIGLVSILVIMLLLRPLVARLIAAIPEAQPATAHQLDDHSGNTPAIPAPEDFGDEVTPELTAAAVRGDPRAMEAYNRAKSEGKIGGQPLGIEAEIDVAQIEGKVKESAIKKVGDIVTNHPEEAAAVVRGWLYSD